MRILFLNGPPGCGKDTAADWLVARGWQHLKFAAPLKHACCVLLNTTLKELERTKDIVIPGSGKRIRDVLISVSEDAVKPVMGQGHFGALAGAAIEARMSGRASDSFVFSDSGFLPEIEGCLNYLNDKGHPFEFDIFRISRPGYSFHGDSRSYLQEGITIDNDGTLEEFKTRIMKEIERW